MAKLKCQELCLIFTVMSVTSEVHIIQSDSTTIITVLIIRTLIYITELGSGDCACKLHRPTDM